jgi:hypothetical protein
MVNVETLLDRLLAANLPADHLQWITSRIVEINNKLNSSLLYETFCKIPSVIKKQKLTLSNDEENLLKELWPENNFSSWDLHRFCRVWLLSKISHEDEEIYFQKITDLFEWSDMNELVALFSALPLLAYPEKWVDRCKEGIRSNIGIVLEAIMCNNPYPSRYLDEPSWNQLVVKAVFTEKPIQNIIGLTTRANTALSNMLTDLVAERVAAKRNINPQVWPLIAPYLNERSFPVIESLIVSDNELNVLTAWLICLKSNFEPAKALIKKHEGLLLSLLHHDLIWTNLITN